MRWAILVVFVAGCGQAAATAPVATVSSSSAVSASQLAPATAPPDSFGPGTTTTGSAIDWNNPPPQMTLSVSGAGMADGSLTMPLRVTLNTGERIYDDSFFDGTTLNRITYQVILAPAALQANVIHGGPLTGTGGNPVLGGHSSPGRFLFNERTQPPASFTWTDGTATVTVSP